VLVLVSASRAVIAEELRGGRSRRGAAASELGSIQAAAANAPVGATVSGVAPNDVAPIARFMRWELSA
jgi:hypothetical protein